MVLSDLSKLVYEKRVGELCEELETKLKVRTRLLLGSYANVVPSPSDTQ